MDEKPKSGDRFQRSRNGALEACAHIAQALQASELSPEDRALGSSIVNFVRGSDYFKEVARRRDREQSTPANGRVTPQRDLKFPANRPAPEVER